VLLTSGATAALRTRSRQDCRRLSAYAQTVVLAEAPLFNPFGQALEQIRSNPPHLLHMVEQDVGRLALQVDRRRGAQMKADWTRPATAAIS